MIQFFNVDLSYGNKKILHHITFQLKKGEFVYLIGPTGAGKSSVLKLIYFDAFPDAGTVIINQYSSAKIRIKDIPYVRRKVGVIFQDFKLLSDRNVFDNVAFALHVTGTKTSVIKKKVLRILNEVGLDRKSVV